MVDPISGEVRHEIDGVVWRFRPSFRAIMEIAAEHGLDPDSDEVRTEALRVGDHFIVNGQKIWTTNGDTADWVWLAVRTDPDAPPHKGITMLLVPTSDPGYSCTLINTLASHDTTASYYENVRVPVSHRVGEENQGWRLIVRKWITGGDDR